MFRQVFFIAIAAVCLLSPATVIAGGPPWLCLPIDGVTNENTKVCEHLLGKALNDKVWSHPDRQSRIQLQQYKDQWYLTFHMQEDVGLQEIESALHGSEFKIPRDKLRLFGHVVLEIESQGASTEALVKDLDALDRVSITKSDQQEKLLLVTVDMPYPEMNDEQERGSIGWDNFIRCDFSSDQATRAELPITSRELPSFNAFHDIVTQRNAKLKDIRWDSHYACRPLGAVAVENQESVASAK
jgi:hypothetical protein